MASRITILVKKMDRRRSLQAILAFAAKTPATAFAQAYPMRPIRVIVPFPAGGTNLSPLFAPSGATWLW